MFIKPEDWKPADGLVLEPTAEFAVRSNFNSVITAGPGAGKTELLAQRACYLLETNSCTSPQKILAISFKVDAAANLKKRVEQRCGRELSHRFESRTFDSFAKQILDMFRLGLPESYRPNANYDLVFSEREIKDIVTHYITERFQNNHNWMYEIDFRKLSKKLSTESIPVIEKENDIYSWVLVRLWKVLLHGKGDLTSKLTFEMISKLACFLLKKNPHIVNVFRMTYSHVFLDEFQDTTNLQYELLKVIFHNSATILTAVGDEKQRIMGWAGALPNAFKQFKEDFAATEIELISNYRSAPKLVEIQNVLSKKIKENSPDVQVSQKWNELDGLCQVWLFVDHQHEAMYLAKEIQKRIHEENLKPRDICVLVKQQERIYAKALMQELRKYSINSRMEREYQGSSPNLCVNSLS